MATLILRSFSRPEMLRSVHPARLVRYLRPYQSFFASRGITLPDTAEGDSEESLRQGIDYDSLTCAFASPDNPLPQAPVGLIESACIIDELATPEGMDSILTGADEQGLDLGEPQEDQAPIDVAIHAWLEDPDFVQSKHAEQYLDRPRSFEYFPRDGVKPADMAKWTDSLRAKIETEMDAWFEKHRRGRGSRVFRFPRVGTTWYLIRHGEPLRREGSLDNGTPSSVVYRPERFDVLVYDHQLDELRMNAQSKGEKTLYREVFGKHLFADSAYFGVAAKYTLDPIRVDKRNCLVCDDIPGIEWIKLQEAQFFWGGAENEIEIRKASDLFAAYDAKNREMPQIPKIIKARFELKFLDSKTTRKVIVNAHTTQCVRDADTVLIEAWLAARGFTSCGTDALEDISETLPEVLVNTGVLAGLESKLRGMVVAVGPGVRPGSAPAAPVR